MTRAYNYLVCNGYNKSSKRFKRRDIISRYTCKSKQKFYSFIDKFYDISHLYTVDKVINYLTSCLC